MDARYVGQGYELRVPIDMELLERDGTAAIVEAFHALHARQYGISHPAKRVDAVSFRLAAVLPRGGEAAYGPSARPVKPETSRKLTFLGKEDSYRVIDRAAVAKDAALPGPLVIVEDTTSTVVPKGWSASADASGNLRIRRMAA